VTNARLGLHLVRLQGRLAAQPAQGNLGLVSISAQFVVTKKIWLRLQPDFCFQYVGLLV
jgi:hypothetical protein